MSDLMTDFAMALLREMGLNPDGSARAPSAPAASVGISTAPSVLDSGLFVSPSAAPAPAPTTASAVATAAASTAPAVTALGGPRVRPWLLEGALGFGVSF
jgi:hypothetical protein